MTCKTCNGSRKQFVWQFPYKNGSIQTPKSVKVNGEKRYINGRLLVKGCSKCNQAQSPKVIWVGEEYDVADN